jgi:ribosomal protein S18 acetylase RimI-like enzyme
MTEQSVVVRRASIADTEALVPLFDAYRQFYEQEPAPERARQFLLDRFRQNESTVFIAEDEARSAVGFAQLFPVFSSVALARSFLLNDLYVRAERRRRGAAQSLLREAAAFAKDLGAARISLSTGVTNGAAQALYEASGWTRQTDYYVYTLKL